MDETQSLKRQGSENAAVLRELLNAAISPKQVAMRCGGENNDEIQTFNLYSPKVFALIEPVETILADRSLLIKTKRKTKQEIVARFRYRIVEQEGKVLRDAIEKWTKSNQEKIKRLYDKLEPFDIENDRTAELLLPLQAVLHAAEDRHGLSLLEAYAKVQDAAEDRSHDITLLKACREIFGEQKYVSTASLRQELGRRSEEPWLTFNRDGLIRDIEIADLLRPFGITPRQKSVKVLGRVQNSRGYYAKEFQDAWSRYLPS